MANRERRPLDLSKVIGDKLPDGIDDDVREHVRKNMLENPELWITAARYDSLRGPGREDRIALIMSAIDVGKAATLGEWSFEAQSYSPHGMQFGGRTKGDNPDRPARAFYTQTSVIRLLELVGAPPALVDDVKHLLKTSQPKGSKKRAALQEALIKYPELADSPSALAEKAGCDRKWVERCLADGSVQRLPLDS